jgi:transcriptional regulator with PAS, ATPase and Fis domain
MHTGIRLVTPLNKQSLQSLIDTQENPFVLIDGDFRILAANRAYHVNYGIEPDQVIGRYCYEISHRRDRPCYLYGEDCPHQQVFQTGELHRVLHTHYDNAGRPEHVCIKGHPITGPEGQLYLGESIHRLAMSTDLDCDEMRMVGRSPALLRAIEQLTLTAGSNANLLLLGESGVGKELAAHYVHQQSPRANNSFISVDCTTLSEPLFESEMFGHERGAFTGCLGRKQGLFELADGGTLFLDEVGEIPLPMQAKLLRILETGEFRRIGGRETLHADVRLVAATNRDLREEVRAGAFREDLYYRIACVTVQLPSLRERRSDLPALAEALLARINQAGAMHCFLTAEAIDDLMHYDFPGNVRELRNILQRAAALCSGGVIGPQELGLHNHAPLYRTETATDSAGVVPMRELEMQQIRDQLQRCHGNRRQAAQRLGISERTLYRKLKRHGPDKQH